MILIVTVAFKTNWIEAENTAVQINLLASSVSHSSHFSMLTLLLYVGNLKKTIGHLYLGCEANLAVQLCVISFLLSSLPYAS